MNKPSRRLSDENINFDTDADQLNTMRNMLSQGQS